MRQLDAEPTVVTTTAPYSATDLVVGTGTMAIRGNLLTVGYTGWLHDSTGPTRRGHSSTICDVLRVHAGRRPGDPGLGSGASPACGWEDSAGSCFLRSSPMAARGPARFRPNATLVFDIGLLNVQ